MCERCEAYNMNPNNDQNMARVQMRIFAMESTLGSNLFRAYGMPRRMTRETYRTEYPFKDVIRPMRCVADVISTLEEITALASENTNASSLTRERAALAAEVLAEVVLYTLTTHTGQESSEVSFARLVTRHFAKFGTTPQSLRRLLNIFVTSRQLQHSDESR